MYINQFLVKKCMVYVYLLTMTRLITQIYYGMNSNMTPTTTLYESTAMKVLLIHKILFFIASC